MAWRSRLGGNKPAGWSVLAWTGRSSHSIAYDTRRQRAVSPIGRSEWPVIAGRSAAGALCLGSVALPDHHGLVELLRLFALQDSR